MPIFISYSREDSAFVDRLAKNLVMRRHNIWMDRWEMNVGDSLIDKIQGAITESSAILVILSKRSVASEWCRKELNSGLMRELAEKKVLVLPCVIDDCEIPLFLREKKYADFRKSPDEAFGEIDDALLRITNRQQGRSESPDFLTDWAYDWKSGRRSGLWYFDWVFVDHGPAIQYCVLTRCQLACNPVASEIFERLGEAERQVYIWRAFTTLVGVVNEMQLKIQLNDAFEKFELMEIKGAGKEAWLAEITSRRLGVDVGKDTLVHVDQIFQRALEQMKAEGIPRK
ncbi:MAG TPA: toll/interleukin-1 receptor domain-containing protein [Micropepsaceae bacterium]|nr:toll/interleukin-1 receptor domain-containing protein [Micropepsaceae bacterium]